MLNSTKIPVLHEPDNYYCVNKVISWKRKECVVGLILPFQKLFLLFQFRLCCRYNLIVAQRIQNLAKLETSKFLLYDQCTVVRQFLLTFIRYTYMQDVMNKKFLKVAFKSVFVSSKHFYSLGIYTKRVNYKPVYKDPPRFDHRLFWSYIYYRTLYNGQIF
jgi:hypothetical protein